MAATSFVLTIQQECGMTRSIPLCRSVGASVRSPRVGRSRRVRHVIADHERVFWLLAGLLGDWQQLQAEKKR
jgi:hypothetical protein